jgi:hypothetical protein
VFEGALLFVAANTGFLGGPAVLANMAVDRWAPNQFSSLSSRLVTRNGVLLMGIAALAILAWTVRNFVFVSIGTVDRHAFGSDQALRTLQYETRAALDGLVNCVHLLGIGSRWYDAYPHSIRLTGTPHMTDASPARAVIGSRGRHRWRE